jgi:hypothetical protein
MATEKPTFDPTDERSAFDAAEAQAALDGTLQGNGRVVREDLARKAADLVAKAQAILEQLDIHTAAGDVEVDREVRQALNELNEVYVSHAQSEFVYVWIYRDPTGDGGNRWVRAMQGLGYELVMHDMPEAKEHTHVTGCRVVADCVLMRVRIDRKMLLDRRDVILRQAQQAGVTARVYDLADRVGSKVYDRLPDFMQDTLSQQATSQAQARAEFHRRNAGGKFDRMLKSGSIPGMPAPGAGSR